MYHITNSDGRGSKLYGIVDYMTDRTFDDRVDAVSYQKPFAEIMTECFRIQNTIADIRSEVKQQDGGKWRIKFRLYQK